MDLVGIGVMELIQMVKELRDAPKMSPDTLKTVTEDAVTKAVQEIIRMMSDQLNRQINPIVEQLGGLQGSVDVVAEKLTNLEQQFNGKTETKVTQPRPRSSKNDRPSRTYDPKVSSPAISKLIPATTSRRSLRPNRKGRGSFLLGRPSRREYRCEACNKSFENRDIYRQHNRQVHPRRPRSRPSEIIDEGEELSPPDVGRTMSTSFTSLGIDSSDDPPLYELPERSPTPTSRIHGKDGGETEIDLVSIEAVSDPEEVTERVEVEETIKNENAEEEEHGELIYTPSELAELPQHEKDFIKLKPFGCKCNRMIRFTMRKNLRRHIRSKTKWALSCLHCRKRFYDESSLNSHIKEMHTWRQKEQMKNKDQARIKRSKLKSESNSGAEPTAMVKFEKSLTRPAETATASLDDIQCIAVVPPSNINDLIISTVDSDQTFGSETWSEDLNEADFYNLAEDAFQTPNYTARYPHYPDLKIKEEEPEMKSNPHNIVKSISDEDDVHAELIYTAFEMERLHPKVKSLLLLRPFGCKCGVRFSTERSLQRHIEYRTSVWKEHCNKCGKYFFNESYLNYHMKKTHRKRKRGKGKMLLSDSPVKKAKTAEVRTEVKIKTEPAPQPHTTKRKSLLVHIEGEGTEILPLNQSQSGVPLPWNIKMLHIPNLSSDRPLTIDLAAGVKEFEWSKISDTGQKEHFQFSLGFVCHSNDSQENTTTEDEQETWLSLQMTLLNASVDQFSITINVEADFMDNRSRLIRTAVDRAMLHFSESDMGMKYVRRNLIRLSKQMKERKLKVYLIPSS